MVLVTARVRFRYELTGNFPYLESSIKNINHTFVMNDVIYAASLLSCDCEAASADSECIK